MKAWRIYRLPGSRKLWHIDSGPGASVFNVLGFRCFVNSYTVDIPKATQQPRAWIEIPSDGVDLHVTNGIACFSFSSHPVNELGTLETIEAAEKQAVQEIEHERKVDDNV